MEKSKSINIWLYSILGAALIIVFFWGAAMQRSARALEDSVENNYNRAFHDLVSYIDDIDTQLTKAQLASSPAQLATISSDIFRQAAEAKSCLGQLPTSDVQLDNTAKFLSQVGDYTYVLSQDMINGTEISAEAYDNLASLNERASTLHDTLSDIQQRLYSGDIKISEITKVNDNGAAQAAGSDILTDLENVEKSFEQYPALIYDGPFSEHIENRESQMLKDAPQVTRSEALRKAQEFLGAKGQDLEFESLSENTAIESYTFRKTTDDDDISISVTKNGGYILYYLNNTDTGAENYDISAATKAAAEFLASRGYPDMVSSYYEKTDGVATINFAYSQDGVVCYSDLVKVRVALDTGDITGLEAKGYLMNHTERTDTVPAMSAEEARNYVSTRLDVSSSGLAIIPKDSLQEVLCYEFHGTFMDKNFLVYVNAANGREEEIFLLIESEDGILTV